MQSRHLLVRGLLAAKRVAPGRFWATVVVLVAGAGAVVAACLHDEPPRDAFCLTHEPEALPEGEFELRSAFYDDDESRLRALARDLEAHGYAFDEISQHGPCWPCETRTLHVRRTDARSRGSYRAEEAQLCGLAYRHGVEAYWGSMPTDERALERW